MPPPVGQTDTKVQADAALLHIIHIPYTPPCYTYYTYSSARKHVCEQTYILVWGHRQALFFIFYFFLSLSFLFFYFFLALTGLLTTHKIRTRRAQLTLCDERWKSATSVPLEKRSAKVYLKASYTSSLRSKCACDERAKSATSMPLTRKGVEA